MNRQPGKSFVLVLSLCFVILPLALPAGQPAAGKKPVSYDVYDSWRSIQGTQLSRDGAWLVYSLVPQDGDGELVALNLKTDKEFRAARGNQPAVTPDGKFVVFSIAPLKADVDKAKKEKKKPEEQPKSGLGIMDLATGRMTTVERVKSFKLPEEAPTLVAYLLEPPLKKGEDKKDEAKPAAEPKKEEPEKQAGKEADKKEEKKKEPGADLLIRELATGKEIRIPEVAEVAWNKPGTRLVYSVSSKTPENDGAYVWEAASARTTALLKGLGNYKALAFDEKGARIAFVSDRDEYQADAPKPGPKDTSEPIKVDIWSWKDPFLQPMQKAQADEEKKRSYLCVMHLGPKEKDRKFVRLGAPDLPEITLSEDARLAVGTSDVPYRQLASWDREYMDIDLVSLADGSRKKVLEKSPYDAQISPGGTNLLYYNDEDNNYYTYRIADGKRFNLTGKLGVRFDEETWDEPIDPSPYGPTGWTDGDKSVLLYDRYDIWEVSPDGLKARMITKGVGRRDGLVFRYRNLDPELKTVPVKEPILLAVTNDKTQATGTYRVTLAADAGPAKVVMLDKLFGGLQKAKNADVYVFTLQRFEEFPDLWVSGPDFADARRVSRVNPQQAEYNWGRAEIIDYVNADGKILPAVLIKPEDFDPSKQYPLMVYIYETLASGLHRYYPPSPGTSINFTRYVSNEYVILMPDIVYEVGYPGSSALKCVLPAVEKVLGLGFIDPKRIGIQGHSWGGYQISYLVTQTNIFAAVQAGASVTNMTSAYGGIRWRTGMSRAWQYEKSQSRIGASLWSRTLQFVENSPLFWVERVQTPYLSIHNDEDDAVPWYQGIEFFSALRRLGKEAYMFNYNGEKHGLRERENQKHWTVHQDEFFDHFLMGTPRPDWMENGVPYLERGKRDIDSLFKRNER